MEIADSFEGRPDGAAGGQSQSNCQRTQIVPEEFYLNRIGGLAAFVPRTRKRKARSPSPELTAQSAQPSNTDTIMDEGLTQKSTQPFEDPRRLGKNVSDVSDSDLSDVICILYPNSSAALEAVQATMLVAPQHILQNDDLGDVTQEDLDLNPAYSRPREIALRISSVVKKPVSGFTFGRNRQHCDVLLVKNEAEKNVSNSHFRVFVNGQGSLMIEDTSTNGTLVDDEHLRCKDRTGRHMSKPATRALRSGSLICVVGPNKAEIKLMVRVPLRGDQEDVYEKKLKKYLQDRGKVAHFASMRENALGNHWNGGTIYNFTAFLGKGAFATVYRVQTKKEGTYLAAKELDKRRFIKNGILDLKFDSELKIMQGLRHPNIVQYIDHHDYEQWIYILMEYVPFGELSTELAKHGPIAEPIVQTITRQILHALNYLHRRGITHRDIKPDNILIASRDPLIVKLSDFGLSKCVKDQETFLKTFCGTILYCAPEIYPGYEEYERGLAPKRRRLGEPAPRTSPYDQSVDMWSFGAVLFHLLCGKAPIMGRGDDKGAQMLNNIMTKDVDFTPLREHGTSEFAMDFISKLMNRNPTLRPKEPECFQHAWIRDVPDAFDYSGEEEIPAIFSQNLDVVQEVDEDQYDDEADAIYQAVRDLEPGAPTGKHAERAAKRLRTQGPEDTGAVANIENPLYPVLPVLADDAAVLTQTSRPGAEQRLFGEITASVLRSSGVFGNAMPTATEVRDVQNRVEKISVNDFVTRLRSEEPLGDDHGSAASLFGAEAQIGQLNMASPANGGFSENVSTPDTTNPITPQARDSSPSGVLTQSEEEIVGESYGSDGSPTTSFRSPPKFSRQIDLALLADDAAFTKSVEARDASRAQKLQQKASTFHAHPGRAGLERGPADSIELARTIDARTGKEVEHDRRHYSFDRTIWLRDTPSIPASVPRAEDSTLESSFGTLSALPGSAIDLNINLSSRMTSWGRGVDCTIPYADKKDVRVPKYAIKVTFWAPGMEQHIESGGDWKKMQGIRTVISTSASQCIWVNDIELRKETVHGDAALFGQIYTGDVVTIFKSSDPKGPSLKFKVDIAFGDSSRSRPESENGFRIQQERRYHRVMKERESMRLSGSDLGRTQAVDMTAVPAS